LQCIKKALRYMEQNAQTISFSSASTDAKTEQKRTFEEFITYGSEAAEGTKSKQMGARRSPAPLEALGQTGSPAALHGCGLPTEDADESLVTTVVFS